MRKIELSSIISFLMAISALAEMENEDIGHSSAFGHTELSKKPNNLQLLSFNPASTGNLSPPSNHSQKLREREEVTERPTNKPSDRQVLLYSPSGTRGLVYPDSYNPNSVYPNGVYPSNTIPSDPNKYNPTSYNPSSIYPNRVYPSNTIPYDPSNPANNPAYNPSADPKSYPRNFSPAGTNGGGYLANGATEAFTAKRASPLTRPGSRIIFSETLTQIGTGWNRARSEFVSTNSGLFFFTFSAVSDRYSHFRISLIKNGLEVVSAFGDASGYQSGSQSALVNLAPGDRVYLQLQEGRVHEASTSSRRAYTTFTGVRV